MLVLLLPWFWLDRPLGFVGPNRGAILDGARARRRIGRIGASQRRWRHSPASRDDRS
jgi:hypothetical protein